MQPVGVDRSMIQIGQQMEVDLAFFIGGNFGRKFFAGLWRVNADRKQSYVLVFLEKGA